MRRLVSLAVLPAVAAGVIVAAGSASAVTVHPDAFCIYSVNGSTHVYRYADTRRGALYALHRGDTVAATDTPISGYGGPFLRGEKAGGSATGYIPTRYLYAKRGCAE